MMSLADAIISEDLNQVYSLLQYGKNLNQLDEYGFTPLVEAAIADNLAIAQLLLEFGAEVNFQDSLGNTPLHWSVENNNFELSQLLLSKGADPNKFNLAGQPVLIMPLLRRQQSIKNLLIKAGANLAFAQDFINTKFLGHLYELVGTANIVSPSNEFVEVDFEGFFLEVTLSMISDSIHQFRSHYAGRKMRQYAPITSVIETSFFRAAELIQYQQYRVDINRHRKTISTLLHQEPLIIPVGYEGHAITFVKFKHLLVKCDRREDSRLYDNVVFYEMKNANAFSIELINHILFERQTSVFINEKLPSLLDLKMVTELKIPAQVSGNCSWANVEACIPVLFFLLCTRSQDFVNQLGKYKQLALDFFYHWRKWSKDRALNFLIQSYYQSDSIRKVCKAEILAAILYQTSMDESVKSENRFQIIAEIFKDPLAFPILKNYIKSYFFEDKSVEADHFMQLLKQQGLV